MKRNFRNVLSLAIVVAFQLPFSTFGQDAAGVSKDYGLNIVKQLPATPVKNQQRTGTCWSFATTSFIESELLRKNQGEYNLSEMYFVRNAYESKASRYVRFHGKAQFGQGGQAHDVMNVIRKNGMVPEAAYPGLKYGTEEHNHNELSGVLSAYLAPLVKSDHLTTAWDDAYKGILDAYLGKDPESFDINGKTYTPENFVTANNFNPDDYIEFTSYSIYPWYQKAELEVPDNWSHSRYYNIPLKDLVDIMKSAIEKGYTVCWDGDVSDPGFNHRKALAILPRDREDLSGKSFDSVFTAPVEEMQVTDADREKEFDNYATTDDHLMHITGLAKDKKGTMYFITKNSWGANSNKAGGYLYMSEPYVSLETIAIMIHKDAIPGDLRKKLDL